MGPTRSASRIALRLVAACALALASIMVAGWVALAYPSDTRPLGTRLVVRESTHAWIVASASAVGITWHLAESARPLTVPIKDVESLPIDWDDPGDDGWKLLSRRHSRTGILLIGWPAPWIGWRFGTEDPSALFPPAPEVSDESAVLQDACRRVLLGEGQAVIAPKAALRIAPWFVLFAVFWYAVIELIMRRGGSAGRSTQTGTSPAPEAPSQRST